MVEILAVNQEGSLSIPADILAKITARDNPQLSPNDRFAITIENQAIVLRLIPSLPSARGQTSATRVAQWETWANSHLPNSQPLPDQALHRDTMYD